MLLRNLVLCILITASCCEAQIPVLLRVLNSEQNDTTGCNIVKELAAVTYNEIMNGHVRLWDGPTHELQIFPQSLISIETSSHTSFKSCETVYIYEFWTTDKTLKSVTQGFMFTGKDASNQDIGYGYVEYKDLEQAFLINRINVNANGNYNANLASYLNNKNYNFRIIQYGTQVISSVNESADLIHSVSRNRKWNPSSFSTTEIPQKLVKWLVNNDTLAGGDKAVAAQHLIAAVNEFLHSNEEIVYNNGADHLVHENNWNVTRLDVVELWKKINGEVLSDLAGITVYINGEPMPEFPYRDIAKFDLKVDGISLNDFLRRKGFYYTILSINDQPVQRSASPMYQKALLTFDWNKLTEYVKYY